MKTPQTDRKKSRREKISKGRVFGNNKSRKVAGWLRCSVIRDVKRGLTEAASGSSEMKHWTTAKIDILYMGFLYIFIRMQATPAKPDSIIMHTFKHELNIIMVIR